MELDESSAEGAARETLEEAGAGIEVVRPFVHFDIPAIGQTYLLFHAKLVSVVGGAKPPCITCPTKSPSHAPASGTWTYTRPQALDLLAHTPYLLPCTGGALLLCRR